MKKFILFIFLIGFCSNLTFAMTKYPVNEEYYNFSKSDERFYYISPTEKNPDKKDYYYDVQSKLAVPYYYTPDNNMPKKLRRYLSYFPDGIQFAKYWAIRYNMVDYTDDIEAVKKYVKENQIRFNKVKHKDKIHPVTYFYKDGDKLKSLTFLAADNEHFLLENGYDQIYIFDKRYSTVLISQNNKFGAINLKNKKLEPLKYVKVEHKALTKKFNDYEEFFLVSENGEKYYVRKFNFATRHIIIPLRTFVEPARVFGETVWIYIQWFRYGDV